MAESDPVLSDLRKEREKLLEEIKQLRSENGELLGAVRGSVLKDVGVPEKARPRFAAMYDGDEWTPDAVRRWIDDNGLSAILAEPPEAPAPDDATQQRLDAQERLNFVRQHSAPPTGATPSLEDRIADVNARLESTDPLERSKAIHELALLNTEMARSNR